jgi:hypothetical protein
MAGFGSVPPARKALPTRAPAPRIDPRMAALRTMMKAQGPVGNLRGAPTLSGLPPGSRAPAQAQNEGLDPLRSLTSGWS